MKFDTVKQNLEARGYAVQVFSTGKEAADYLDAAIDKTSVGFGGSATLEALGLYERLGTHNQTVWHWKWEDKDAARQEAQAAGVYLTSVNALAETGELVNIDGAGNRVASTLFGHKKVYFVIGRNKLVPTVGNEDVEPFLDWLESFSQKSGIKYTISISEDAAKASDGVKKYF